MFQKPTSPKESIDGESLYNISHFGSDEGEENEEESDSYSDETADYHDKSESHTNLQDGERTNNVFL